MRRITTTALAGLAILAWAPRDSRTMVITTAHGNGADTYVNGQGSLYNAGETNYGSNIRMTCRRSGGDYTRKGYVRFDVPAGIHASDVTLKVTVSSVASQSGATTMNVWGLNDGYPGVDNSVPANGSVNDDEDTHDEFWPEMVIDWFSAPGNAGDTTMDPASTALLGTFTVPLNAPRYTTLSFNDPDLTAMVLNDTNGAVVLAMQPAATSAYVYLYTKEGTGTIAYQPQLVFAGPALTWDGEGGANKDWSHAANWDADGLPLDSATFNDTATAAAGTVTNIVDEDFAVGSLTYQHTSNAHTTQIDTGVTLRVVGEGTGRSLVVGNVASGGVTTRAIITGGGKFVVNSPGEDILVTGASTSSPTSTAALDMSGLAEFEATVNEFRVGTGHFRYVAQATLAETNTIVADAVVVGSNTYTTTSHFMRLGQTNTIHSNKIIVGGARSTATLEFDPTLSGTPTPTVTIRGKAGGTSRANAWIGDQQGNGGYGAGGSSHARGTVDLTAGSVDAMFGTLIVGRNGWRASGVPGAATGILSFDEGTIDATEIILARTPNLPSTGLHNYTDPNRGHTYGTLNMGGGTLLAGSMMIGEVQGQAVSGSPPPISRSTRATGTFNLSGGTATVTGNVTLAHHTSDGPSEATGIINITGGTLDVGGSVAEGIGGAISVSTLNLHGGTMTIGDGLHVDNLTIGDGSLTASLNLNGGTASDAGNLNVRSNSSTANTVTIAGGHTLTINGPVTIGLTTAHGVTTRAAIAGQGTLTINSPSNDFLMTGYHHAGGVSRSTLALDMSGLATFNATVNEFLAPGGYINANSQLTLAETNTITADATVFAAWSGAAGGTNFVRLGQTNTIHTDKLVISGGRASSTTEFDPGLSGTPTVEIRGKAGGSSRADLWVADQRGEAGYSHGGSNRCIGVADFTAGSIDAMLDTVIIGRNGSVASRQPGAATGTLSFGAGTINATEIILARTPALPNTDLSSYDVPNEGHTYGTLDMGGGTLIAGSMTLGEVQGHAAPGAPPAGDKPLSTRATGTFNLSDGMATVAGSITLGHHTSNGPSTATGTINFSGGTLSAGSIVQGSGSNNVSNFNFTGGTLHVHDFGFDLVQDGGTLAPGNSPDTTNISGDYDQNAGILEIEINGHDQGDVSPLPFPDDDDIGYDFVNVGGNADLNGMLQVVLLDGFVPQVGDTFDVLTAVDITLEGGFSLENPPGGMLAGTFFEANVITGGSGEILQLSIGVPEPSTLALAGLGLLGLVGYFRRRRRHR